MKKLNSEFKITMFSTNVRGRRDFEQETRD